MRKYKKILDKYKLTAGIHTICIKTQDSVNTDLRTTAAAVKSIKYNHQTGFTKIIINANKLNGFITSYGEFVESLSKVLEELEISNHTLIRADMCFDSYDTEHYKRFAKLNRLVISMMAYAYDVKNRYKTNDLFTNKQLSIAIKQPNSFEIENYDKEKESEGRDIAKSRFEIRSTRMNNKTINEEFIYSWNKRFYNAYHSFDETLNKYNTELIKLYTEEKQINKNYKWSTFLHKYKNCIFTKQQAIKLLQMMGENKPEDKYKYFKRNYNLDTYRKTDVAAAILEIQRARDEFFKCDKGDNSTL